MDDCKKITSTAKEPVVNVKDGAKTANSTLKEISARLKTVSVTPKDPLKCVRVDLKGLGEEWIPDPTLFKYNEDKLTHSDSLYKLVGRGVEEISAALDFLRVEIGKSFTDTAVGSDTVSAVVNWIRNIHDNGGYYSLNYGQDGYVEPQSNCIDILSFSVSKTLREQGVTSDLIAKASAKVFADTAVGSDVLTKGFQASKVEAAITNDVLTAVVVFNLSLQDWAYLTDDVLGNANVDDDQYMSLDKVVLELMTYLDVLVTSLTKVFADITVSSDVLALTASKVATESVSYTDAITSAIGKNPIDTATVSETVSRNSSKVLLDTAIGVDALAIAINKSFADSVVTGDFFRTVGWYGDSNTLTDVFSKSLSIVLDESDYFFSDYVQADYEAGALYLGDMITSAFDKLQNEVSTASDTISYIMTFGRLFEEVSQTSESVAKGISTLRVDTAASSDVISYSMGFGRLALDTAAVSESTIAAVSKVLIDSGNAVDSLVNGLNKVLSESSSLVDSCAITSSKALSDSNTLTDVFSKSLSIVLADLAPISETVNKSVSVSKTESTVTSEVRTANLQNYMAAFYTNPGYIGTTFSI